jgi:hypothetical protein
VFVPSLIVTTLVLGFEHIVGVATPEVSSTMMNMVLAGTVAASTPIKLRAPLRDISSPTISRHPLLLPTVTSSLAED